MYFFSTRNILVSISFPCITQSILLIKFVCLASYFFWKKKCARSFTSFPNSTNLWPKLNKLGSSFAPVYDFTIFFIYMNLRDILSSLTQSQNVSDLIRQTGSQLKLTAPHIFSSSRDTVGTIMRNTQQRLETCRY